MEIANGSRLGPYEVTGRIGAGGMGEVFRARDTRLGRDVALKILPSAFATNAQLKLRFEQEARVISQLNHPNICTLHDVGHENGVEYLVMELIDGESLAHRIGRGRLSFPDVLRYGREIAEALDRAHRAGIVHRDLKPGNIMIARSGAKLLDFGLAKEAPLRIDGNAPTEQQRPITEQGAILGTFQYMAPEQLEGQHVDHRADIFALGCVLYEMVTGQRAFDGKTRTSLIAAIVAAEPRSLRESVPDTPPALEHVIQRCLAKDPEDRWQSAKDVAIELEAITEGAFAQTPSRQAGSRVAWLTAGLLGLVAAAFGIALAMRKPPITVPLNFTLAPPQGMSVVATSVPSIAPDESAIAYAIEDSSHHRNLVVASLRDGTQRRFDEDADDPIWSPDGSTIAFVDAEDQLRILPLRQGTSQILCHAPNMAGMMWLDDRSLLFSDFRRGLFRVSASGGEPALIIDPTAQHAAGYYTPQRIGSGAVAFIVAMPRSDESFVAMRSVDGQITRLMKGSRLFAGPPGTIVFSQGANLYSQSVDLGKHLLSGTPKLLGPATRAAVSRSLTCFVVAPLVRRSRLMWSDRSGRMTEAVGATDSLFDFRLSPDEQSILLSRASGQQGGVDVWLFERLRGVMRRITFNAADDFDAVWTRDGEHILFTSLRDGAQSIYMTTPAGTGVETRLYASKRESLIDDIAPDGDVVFVSSTADAPGSLYVTDLKGRTPKPLIDTPFNTAQAVFSPDGKYLAYKSNESGEPQVFVIDYPSAAHKWQISSSGGFSPKWSRDGRMLYFVREGELYETSVRGADGSFSPGKPQALFGGLSADNGRDTFEPMSDGRFLVRTDVRDGSSELHVIANTVVR